MYIVVNSLSNVNARYVMELASASHRLAASSAHLIGDYARKPNTHPTYYITNHTEVALARSTCKVITPILQKSHASDLRKHHLFFPAYPANPQSVDVKP